MKALLLDIETAPNTVYVWRLFDERVPVDNLISPGYTLCWSAKWLGKREVMFDSIHRSKPDAMIRRIHALLDEADAVIHYNGSRFDIPVLQQEILQLGLTPPSPVKQIDLLDTARKQFRFPSNKLDYVSQALGLGKKVSHKGMELWRGCMAGDAASWRVMERYNRQDVKLLEPLYHKLKPWIKGHPNAALFLDSKRPVCPTCGSHNLQARGIAKTTTLVYHRFQCKECGKWSRGRVNIMSKERKASVLVAA